MHSETDLSDLVNFEKKQGIIGRIFDFAITDNGISILKYYESPNRKTVIIPDFVNGECNDLFMENTYINKIIKHSDKLKTIASWFDGVEVPELDLSEFYMPNIKEAEYAFKRTTFDNLVLSNKNNFNNIVNGKSMFCESEIKHIQCNYEITFEHLVIGNDMFSQYKGDIYPLIHNMKLKELVTANNMFESCDLSNLPANSFIGMFSPSLNTACYFMFANIKFKDLRFGDDFNAADFGTSCCIFDKAEGNELYLPECFEECLNNGSKCNEILGDISGIKTIHIGKSGIIENKRFDYINNYECSYGC